MDYNIVSEYINFISDNFLKFFKLVLGNRYKKNLTQIFIDKYIEVRYYNETNYLTVKDFINRLNKELVDLTEKIAKEDDIEDIKDIVCLFGYLVYFDEVCVVEEEAELINVLVNDELIRIKDKDDTKKEIINWYKGFKESKDNFNNVVNNVGEVFQREGDANSSILRKGRTKNINWKDVNKTALLLRKQQKRK